MTESTTRTPNGTDAAWLGATRASGAAGLVEVGAPPGPATPPVGVGRDG